MTLDLTAFAWLHTLISLVPLVAGAVVVANLIRSEEQPAWTWIFFATIIATSVTGFGFPFQRFLPSHGVGIVSLIVLFAALIARFAFRLQGHARWIYVVGIVAGLWLDWFVLVAQAFNKVDALRALAPTQSEPPFAIAEAVVMLVFVVIGVVAVRAYRPSGLDPAVAA